MAQFAKGDLVKVLDDGHTARVIDLHEINGGGGDEYLLVRGVSFTEERYLAASEVADEYEYEREAGHYGLTPKGIKPPDSDGH